MKRKAGKYLWVLLVVALCPIVFSSQANAEFQPTFSVSVSSDRAGDHPRIDIELAGRMNNAFQGHESLRKMAMRLPAGMVGDPYAVDRCSLNGDGCGPANKVGRFTVDAVALRRYEDIEGNIYLAEPHPGSRDPAAMLFEVSDPPEAINEGRPIRITGRVRLRTSDNRIETVIDEMPTEYEIRNMDIQIGGDAAAIGGRNFITNPTSCAPGTFEAVFESDAGSKHTAIDGPASFTASGCESLPFSPQLGITLSDTRPFATTQISTELLQDAGEAHLRGVQLNFPAGYRPNSELAGIRPCSSKLVRSWGCGAGSSIGNVRATSHLLSGAPEDQRELVGSIHLIDTVVSKPLRIALFLEHPSFDIRFLIVGTVKMRRFDDGSFRMIADFPDLPQVPVESIVLRFEKRLIRNPAACGTDVFHGNLSSWAGIGRLVDSQVNIGPCNEWANQRLFRPTVKLSASDYTAGRHPDVTVTVRRSRGQQTLVGTRLSLPVGLMGNPLAAHPCKLNATWIPGRSWPCPEDSHIGTVTATAVVFSDLPPLKVRGRVYMAERGNFPGRFYIVVNLPIVAGGGFLKLDAPIRIEGADLRISTNIQGLPQEFDIREIKLDLEGSRGMDRGRPLLTNPSLCTYNPASVTLTGEAGTAVDLEAPFRAKNCQAQPFSPALSVSLDPLTPGSSPAITTVVRQNPGEATMSAVTVEFPKQLGLDILKIPKNLCTDAQLKTRTCPAEARLGTATAYSPLLEDNKPLSGGVYMMQGTNGASVRIVAVLDGLISLDVPIDVRVNPKGGLTAVVRSLPPVQVSRFELSLEGGAKGILKNPKYCASLVFKAGFASHSHKTHSATSSTRISGCKASLRAKVSSTRKGRRPSLTLTAKSGDPLSKATIDLGRLKASKRWPKRWKKPGSLKLDLVEGADVSRRIGRASVKVKSKKRRSKRSRIRRRYGLKIKSARGLKIKLVRKGKRVKLVASSSQPFTGLTVRLKSKGPLIEPKRWSRMTFKGKFQTAEGKSVSVKSTAKKTCKKKRKKKKSKRSTNCSKPRGDKKRWL